ncbi:hypothetical protein B0J12DRAFT_39566 [Macrophomina phaseolina]|uniref:Uncharacterized protein n=1 Tax=Macrophomina phaseolina TaxID=35725 RepID=A0ABQ8GWA8_9PEZI|nr:hypothetical protein B0J12DRAFT_39566 [Macrophomina phaseolina]
MHSISIAFTALVGAAAASVNGPWQSHSSWGTAVSSTPSASKTIISDPTIKPSGTGVTISDPTIKPTATGGHNTTETETLTTFTTVTTCPVTQTTSDHGSTYITTALTTSTVVVTSCKGGCHGWQPHPTGAPNSTYVPTDKPTTAPNGTYIPPTHKPSTEPTNKPTALPSDTPTEKPTQPTSKPSGKPTQSEYAPGTTPVVTTKVYPTTIVNTVTSFVPCSTPVGHEGTNTWYSTWLTATFIPHTTVSTYTTVSTLYPAPAPTNGQQGGNGVCPPVSTVTVNNGPTVTAYVTVLDNGNGKPTTLTGKPVYETDKPSAETGKPNSQSGVGAITTSNAPHDVPNPTSKPHWSGSATTDKPQSPTGTGSPSAGAGKKW